MDIFYSTLLVLHSWLRWGVVVLALYALVLAVGGWRSGREWTTTDRRGQLLYVIAIDVQFVLGLLLAFVSPLIRAAIGDMGAAMRTSQLRFFLVEHTLLMLAAIAVAHVFSSRSKKVTDARLRHRRWMTGVIVSFLLILVAIPWPFLGYGRALFRY